MSESEFEYDTDDENIPDTESDDDIIINDEDSIISNIEDSNVFRKNYSLLKKNNNTGFILNKYEITKILSKRCEQLENGSTPLIPNYEKYNNVYDIAFIELKEKKIPFILKRVINNKYIYLKLEDLNF